MLCLPASDGVMWWCVLLLMLWFCRHLWEAFEAAAGEVMWHLSGSPVQMLVTAWWREWDCSVGCEMMCQSALD